MNPANQTRGYFGIGIYHPKTEANVAIVGAMVLYDRWFKLGQTQEKA